MVLFGSAPQLCMLCSVGYHLFCCHRSEKTSRRWMALDYAGVSIGILGCYVPGVFYTFYCNNVSSDDGEKLSSFNQFKFSFGSDSNFPPKIVDSDFWTFFISFDRFGSKILFSDFLKNFLLLNPFYIFFFTLNYSQLSLT